MYISPPKFGTGPQPFAVMSLSNGKRVVAQVKVIEVRATFTSLFSSLGYVRADKDPEITYMVEGPAGEGVFTQDELHSTATDAFLKIAELEAKTMPDAMVDALGDNLPPLVWATQDSDPGALASKVMDSLPAAPAIPRDYGVEPL